MPLSLAQLMAGSSEDALLLSGNAAHGDPADVGKEAPTKPKRR